MGSLKKIKKILALFLIAAALMAIWGFAFADDYESYSLSAYARKDKDSTMITVKLWHPTGPPAGTFEKVEICSLNKTCTQSKTYTYNNVPIVDGFAVFNIKDINTERILAVHAVVKLDNRENSFEIGTAQDVVYRPDLVLENLKCSKSVTADDTFTMSVDLHEVKGHTGSVCFVEILDGDKVIAGSDPILVYQTQIVKKEFQLNFHDVGTHNLKARIKDACPKEYDTNNNQLSWTVQVTSNTPSINNDPTATTGTKTFMQCDSTYKHTIVSSNWRYWWWGFFNELAYENSEDLLVVMTSSNTTVPTTGSITFAIETDHSRYGFSERFDSAAMDYFKIVQDGIVSYNLSPNGVDLSISIDPNKGTYVAYRKQEGYGFKPIFLPNDEPFLNAEKYIKVKFSIILDDGSVISGDHTINITRDEVRKDAEDSLNRMDSGSYTGPSF